jgi:hypothetical protein
MCKQFKEKLKINIISKIITRKISLIWSIIEIAYKAFKYVIRIINIIHNPLCKCILIRHCLVNFKECDDSYV